MNADVLLARLDRETSRRARHPRHRYAPLDLKYAQAGLETRLARAVPLIDGWLSPFAAAAFADALLARRPRLVALHGSSACLDEALAVGARLRRAGVVTVAVGQVAGHARLAPPPGWDDAFDVTLAGEPEAALPALVAEWLAGQGSAPAPSSALPQLAGGVRLARVDDPDALPPPRFSAEELAAYPFPFALRGVAPRRWAYLISAWGCPRPCRHCTALVRKSVDRALRPRALDAVFDELARLANAGADAFAFEDDSLFVHRARFLALCDGLVRRRLTLPWLANARPDELDGETIAAAAAAGARLIKIGVDSGAPAVIEHIAKARNGDEWVERTRRAFAGLDAAGVGSVALFVVGLPGETDADAEKSLALARQLPADYLQVQRYLAYPDVPLWGELDPARRIAGAACHYPTAGAKAAPANCSAIADGELARWPGRFYRAFYGRPGFIARHLRHGWRHYLARGFGGAAHFSAFSAFSAAASALGWPARG